MRKNIITFLIVWIILGSSILHSQAFRNYTIEDGLNSNVIHEVFQDSKGFIWIASDFGVSKFDGSGFQSFSIEDGVVGNMIININEDHHGNIWFGSLYNELSYYSQQADSFYPFPFNRELSEHLIQPIQEIKFSESNMHFSGKNLASDFIIENYLKDSVSIRNNELPTLSTLEVIDDSTRPFTYSYVGSVPDSLNVSGDFEVRLEINKLHRSGTSVHQFKKKAGLLIINQDQLSQVHYNSKSVQNHSIDYLASWEFLEDGSGNVWIGSYNNGVFRYPGGDLEAKPEQFLHGKTTTGIIEDKNGGIWISTLNHGLFYASNSQIRGLLKEDGSLMNAVQLITDHKSKVALTEDYNQLYYGTIDNTSNWTYKTIDLGSPLFNIGFNHDELFMFPRSSNTLYKMLGQEFSPVIKDSVYRFFTHKSSLITLRFTGKKQHVLKYHEQDGSILSSYPIEGVPRIRTFYFVERDKFYLIDKFNQLYYAIVEDATSLSWKKLGEEFKSYEILDVILEENRKILITRKSGGFVLDGADVLSQITFFHSSDTIVNEVFFDAEGSKRTYLLTNHGIFTTTMRSDQPKIFINENLGLPSGEITDMTRIGGSYFVLTSNGTYQFDTAGFQLNVQEPTVQIKSVFLNSAKAGIAHEYTLDAGNHSIQIEMYSVQFENALDIPYRYRIRDQYEWIYTKENRIITSSLEAGSYNLEIQAANALGDWGPSTGLRFVILPPFWRRPAFILLIAAGMLAITLTIFRYRLKITKKDLGLRYSFLEAQSQALASQLSPHFVFNTMNSLSSFISKNEKIQSIRYLAKLAKLMRAIYENSQIAQVPLKVEIDTLRLYIELEQLRFDFNYTIEIEDDLEEQLVPSMIIQPIIENAIKHGFDKEGDDRLLMRVLSTENVLTAEIHNSGQSKSLSMKEIIEKYPTNSISLIFKRLSLIERLFDYHVGIEAEASSIEGYTTVFIVTLPKTKSIDPSLHS